METKYPISFSQAGTAKLRSALTEHLKDQSWLNNFAAWGAEAFEKIRDCSKGQQIDNYEIGSAYTKSGNPFLIAFEDQDLNWSE
jgi:hypothetical protein